MANDFVRGMTSKVGTQTIVSPSGVPASLFPQYVSGTPSGLRDAMMQLNSQGNPQDTLNAWLTKYGWYRTPTVPAGFTPAPELVGVNSVGKGSEAVMANGLIQLLKDLNASKLPVSPQLDLDLSACGLSSYIGQYDPGTTGNTTAYIPPAVTPAKTSTTPGNTGLKAPVSSTGLSLTDPKVIAVGALILAALFSK